MSTLRAPDELLSTLAIDASRFVQFVEALPIGVFIVDAAGHPIYANLMAIELLGRGVIAPSDGETLADVYDAYVTATDQKYPLDRMPIVRALQGERCAIDDMEIHRGTEKIAVEVVGAPILDANGKVAFAVAVFQDIRARREARAALLEVNASLEERVSARTQQLAQTIQILQEEITRRATSEEQLRLAKLAAESASRAKSFFFSNLSHELRTPLNHIIGFSELIAERTEDARTKKLALTVTGSGRDLLDSINQLIELADADSAVGTSQPFDLDEMLDSVMADVRAGCPDGVAFDLRRPPVTGFMQSDPTRVRTVVSNLLRAASEVEHEEVSVERGERFLRVNVHSARLSARLFTIRTLFGASAAAESLRFTQNEVDLRLAVARAYARTIGGELRVSGETHVELTLPLDMNAF